MPSLRAHQKSAAQFDNALSALDEKLARLDTSIEVKAIGGYALLKHGIREGDDAFTVDVDSVTAEYRKPVLEAIKDVAYEQDLAEDWLNTYSVMDDPSHVEEMLQAAWLPQHNNLKRIALSIADLPTLTRSKIMAAADAALSGRSRDAGDLYALARAQGISSISQFRSRYPDPWDEYAEAYNAVAAAFHSELTRKSPELDREDEPDTYYQSADAKYGHPATRGADDIGYWRGAPLPASTSPQSTP